jgi:glucose/arabinose dehydrogenase
MIIDSENFFIQYFAEKRNQIFILISFVVTLGSIMTICPLYAQIDSLSGAENSHTKLLLPQVSPVGSNIFLIWQDNSTGNEEIFLRKSTNGGITFGNTTNVSSNTGFSTSPQIESFGNNTFVIWQDNSTGNEEIFLRKSTNGGITFGNTTNVSSNTGFSTSPQIESFGNNTFVIWQDNSTGNEEIFLRKSTNGGITFGNTTNVSSNTGFSTSPQIESFGNNTFVIWQDNSTGNEEIFLRKSTESGKFSSKKNLSNNTGFSTSPQIESFGNNTFVIWQDNSTGNEEIFLRKSTGGDIVFYDLKNNRELNLEYKGGPVVSDPNLKVQLVVTGINFPTSMVFLGPDDILVLEKNEGKVIRIINGSIMSQPILDVNVANKEERGMLGIAVSKQSSNDRDKRSVYVFLYYTESELKDGEDLKGQLPLGNRLYRFELVGDKLINPKLLLDLPTMPDTVHNGGKILVGPDNNPYLTIGDLTRDNKKDSPIITKAQNHEDGVDADGRAGILRITQNGKEVNGGNLGKNHPLDKYFAYGIRNSFGIAFDPVTGKLWDTESGPEFGDEINLVEPGFNSGWNKVQGIWQTNENFPGNVTANPTGLFNYNNTGQYSAPELTWFDPSIGPTAITFLNSSKLGIQYMNDLFVGGFHDGNIYRFKLDQKRTGLLLDYPLTDKVSNVKNETQAITFAKGFGGVTDMKVGPDGYLYILSLYAGGDDCGPIYQPGNLCISYTKPLNGAIFRIVPR